MELKLENINVSYGSNHALRDISFSMEEGLYGVLGENGAGKSTLIKVLTNNLCADSGHIFIDGREIKTDSPDYLRLIGYVPQEDILYKDFTAREFMEYFAVLKGMNPRRKEVRRQIDEILRQVNLQDVKNHKIATFSGGMRRRALIAQAVLGQPVLLILDEPSAGLDPSERQALKNLIVNLSEGRIVLYATHIATDIETAARKVLILKKGKKAAFASPDDLFETLRKAGGEEKNKTVNLEDVFLFFCREKE